MQSNPWVVEDADDDVLPAPNPVSAAVQSHSTIPEPASVSPNSRFDYGLAASNPWASSPSTSLSPFTAPPRSNSVSPSPLNAAPSTAEQKTSPLFGESTVTSLNTWQIDEREADPWHQDQRQYENEGERRRAGYLYEAEVASTHHGVPPLPTSHSRYEEDAPGAWGVDGASRTSAGYQLVGGGESHVKPFNDPIQRAKDASATKTTSYLSALHSHLTSSIPFTFTIRRPRGRVDVHFVAAVSEVMSKHVVEVAAKRADLKNPVVKVELRVSIKHSGLIDLAKHTLKTHALPDTSTLGQPGGEQIEATYSGAEFARSFLGVAAAPKFIIQFASGSSSGGAWGDKVVSKVDSFGGGAGDCARSKHSAAPICVTAPGGVVMTSPSETHSALEYYLNSSLCISKADVYMTSDDLVDVRDVRTVFVPEV
ncbi:hypothetical protein HDU93_005854 [Gonapodya sp. JEL0774]|nr:hypothetical protein HDU93_005854 [Gonapodya sp. JEL0774]